MARRRKQKEPFPLVAVLGWPLVLATPLLLILVRTGNPRIDPMLRLGFGVPALGALLWAFSKVSDVRRYRKPVLAVLIVSGVEFLGLFLYFFAAISAAPPAPPTQPAPTRPVTQPTRTQPAPTDRGPTSAARDLPSIPVAASAGPA